MIYYKTSGCNLVRNIFRIRGSVFPVAMKISVPVALLTGLLTALIHTFGILPQLAEVDSVMNNNAVWGGFSFLVSFLVVFRTSQAYNRFWQGVTSTHKMGADWFDCCAALMAFCKCSKADQEKTLAFQNTLVRLFSMLHAVALAEIEETHSEEVVSKAFNMDLVDGGGIDEDSLVTVRDSDAKVELIFQWIQGLIVENMQSGVLSIAPPILTRSFQELASGMVHFHDALTISRVPFPFPYAVCCDGLLSLHWVIVPFVVSQWCRYVWWAIIFSWIMVFTMWSLNMIAVELEHPFGSDANDIDGVALQNEMNQRMRLLCKPSTMRVPTPALRDGEDQADLALRITRAPLYHKSNSSLHQIWSDIDGGSVRLPSVRSAASDDNAELTGAWEPCESGGQPTKLVSGRNSGRSPRSRAPSGGSPSPPPPGGTPGVSTASGSLGGAGGGGLGSEATGSRASQPQRGTSPDRRVVQTAGGRSVATSGEVLTV